MSYPTADLPTPAALAQARSDHNHYTSGTRSDWRQEEGEIRAAFSAHLAADYLPDVPASVASRVFSMAWEEGHSAGYRDVESHYEELAEFVTFIKGEL